MFGGGDFKLAGSVAAIAWRRTTRPLRSSIALALLLAPGSAQALTRAASAR